MTSLIFDLDQSNSRTANAHELLEEEYINLDVNADEGVCFQLIFQSEVRLPDMNHYYICRQG